MLQLRDKAIKEEQRAAAAKRRKAADKALLSEMAADAHRTQAPSYICLVLFQNQICLALAQGSM